MTLAEGKIGHDYIIETLDLPDQTEKRLQALGMIEGTEISVLNNKNEGTVIIIPLCTTNIVTNATTRTVTMSGMELPGGRDLGLLFKGTIITNNAQFTVNYQLSPDNVNWTWPYSTLSSGVIASNTVATYAAQLTLSNSVTYPFRYWKIYSITAGTNSLYVSNAVAVYKTDPKFNYSR